MQKNGVSYLIFEIEDLCRVSRFGWFGTEVGKTSPDPPLIESNQDAACKNMGMGAFIMLW